MNFFHISILQNLILIQSSKMQVIFYFLITNLMHKEEKHHISTSDDIDAKNKVDIIIYGYICASLMSQKVFNKNDDIFAVIYNLSTDLLNRNERRKKVPFFKKQFLKHCLKMLLKIDHHLPKQNFVVTI